MCTAHSNVPSFFLTAYQKVLYCQHCPEPLAAKGPPYRCVNGHEYWDPPKPVAVAILRVGPSVVLVQRAIAPKIGDWCLPGGYVQRGETFAAAAARELFEETGISIPIPNFMYLCEAAVLEAGVNLVFFVAIWPDSAPLPDFVHDHESFAVMTCSMTQLPENMAFPTHVDAIQKVAEIS